MIILRLACVALASILVAQSAPAQQRPLLTEDPEPVGAGRVLIESGVDWAHDQQYPLSGLKGNLIAVPTIGISVGISSIAEFQIDGGFYNRLNVTARHPAPLSSLLTTSESTTHDVSDTVIATKIRVLSETAGRPAMGLRFATKLPNASNESGLGLDTIDVFASLLGAKTIQSIRVVSNVGVGILADPISGNRQNDVLTYGLSFARAMTERAEIVGELNGRKSTRGGDAFPGTESRGILKLGGRFTHGPVRFDTGLFFGLAAVDPAIGFTAGFTYVFDAFTIP